MFVDLFLQRLSFSDHYLFEDQVSVVKIYREYVVGERKKQTFDFSAIFDRFCENFCKIKQHIKHKYYVFFMWISRKNSSCESNLFPRNFLYPSPPFHLFHLANICYRMFLQQMVFLRYNRLQKLQKKMNFSIKSFEIKVKTNQWKFSPTKASDCLSMKVKKYLTYFLKYITKIVILKYVWLIFVVFYPYQTFCSLKFLCLK